MNCIVRHKGTLDNVGKTFLGLHQCEGGYKTQLDTTHLTVSNEGLKETSLTLRGVPWSIIANINWSQKWHSKAKNFEHSEI